MKPSEDRNISRREFVRSTAAAMAVASAYRFSAAHAGDKAEDAWKMRLATSSVMFDKLPIEQVCERVARLELQAVDIWAPFHWGGAQCTHLEDVKNRLGGKGLRELLTKHKLDVAAFTIYGNKLSEYRELIRDYGGGVVVRSAGAGRLKDPKELTPRMRAFFEKLKPDIELAEKCNARLLHVHLHASLVVAFPALRGTVTRKILLPNKQKTKTKTNNASWQREWTLCAMLWATR